MRKYAGLFLVLILLVTSIACKQSAPQSPSYADTDLFVVVGHSAYTFTGNGNGDGLPLDKFSKENKMSIYVQVANDREIRNFRDKMLTDADNAPDVLIVDDSLDIDGLQKIKMIASHNVGVAIRSDIADALGLQGNTMSYTEFVPMMEAGNLSVVASSAMAGSASREFFFSTMAWCAQMDAANLTADIVRMDYVQACGKEVFDYVKSTNGANDALSLVHNAAISGDPAGSNTIIAFDSDLLGPNGLNTRLSKEGKPVFKFFYFREATARASVAIGTKDFGADETTATMVNDLIEFMISEESQEAINLAGFTEGSAALVRHNDTAFIAEWGVSSNPPVQIVNAPISMVASQALEVYRDYYKRNIVFKIPLDTSPSMFQNSMWVDIDGKQTEVFRIQALNLAILKTTKSSWLAENEIKPGLNDRFDYYFFSTDYTGLVAQTIGPETDAAGALLSYYLSETDINRFDAKTIPDFGGFQSNGTHIFDVASEMLSQIIAEYDPNVDYVIVIFTDGENDPNFGLQADAFYDQWNAFFGKNNITVIGIQFGGDEKSIAVDCTDYCSSIGKAYTQQFGGNTYFGNNDAQLVDAFKQIFGR